MKLVDLAKTTVRKPRLAAATITAATALGLTLIGGGLSAAAQATPAVTHTSAELAASSRTAIVPEAAAATDYIEFFYSPNCTNAGRVYTGDHTHEPWILDTFNNTAHGTAGNGQGIYENAASFYVYGGSSAFATVWGYTGASVLYYPDSTPLQPKQGACLNLGSLRNQNTYFSFNG